MKDKFTQQLETARHRLVQAIQELDYLILDMNNQKQEATAEWAQAEQAKLGEINRNWRHMIQLNKEARRE